MKFDHIREALAAENSKYLANMIRYATESDASLERYSTATRWNNFKTGKASRDETLKYAIARFIKAIHKDTKKKLELISNAESDETAVKIITIDVIYKRNRVWGWNPTATVTIRTNKTVERYSANASGCGYDKGSAAIASALNKSESLKSEIIRMKERFLSENKPLPYGMGGSAIPYFEGGCGYSTIKHILENAGFTEVVAHGTDTTDFYYFERKDA